MAVEIAENTLTADVEPGEDRTTALGTIHVKPGPLSVAWKASQPLKGVLLRPCALLCKPVN